MKLNRSKNAIRNSKYGIIYTITSIILPFIVRTVFIKQLGENYLGVNSLFTSILTVLNMTELGFSSAITFSMYKPIADDDDKTICALLRYYKKVYLVLGTIILLIGSIILPFLPNLISGSYPEDINLYAVYIIFLINTVISYFLFGYLSAIINAFQRNDIINKINILTVTLSHVAQIIILLVTNNYYLYVLTMPVFTIMNNLITALAAKKYFYKYRPIGKLERKYKKQIKEKLKGLIINKVCIVSRNAFDSIFISMFLGLAITAKYNNYYYIMNSVISISSVLLSAMLAGIGNSVCLDSEEKNYNDMNRMNFVYMWFSGFCSIALLCLYQPFMKIWLGEEYLLSNEFVILVCLYYYALKMGDIRSIYDQANGLWWENRHRTMLEALSNLVLNYFLGKWLGIYGIVLATLITILVINFGFGSRIVFKYYFKHQKVNDYYKRQTKYAVVTILAGGITFYICNTIQDQIITLPIKAIICLIVPNALFYLIYRHSKDYRDSSKWLLNRIRKPAMINNSTKK